MSYCIKCGHKNDSTTKFCINCGSQLHPPIPSTAISQAPSHQLPDGYIAPVLRRPAPQTNVDFGKWFSKNKVYVLSALGLIVVMWAVNYFFFKAHPEKDGVALANAECGCEEKRMTDIVNNKKELLKNFDTYHFASSYQVRQKLDSFDTDAQQAFTNCIQQVIAMQAKKNQAYLGNPESLATFNQQYYNQKQLCKVERDDLTKVTQEIRTRLLNFTPYSPQTTEASTRAQTEPPAITKAEEPGAADNSPSAPPNSPEPNNGVLTDEIVKNKIISLYNQENSIGSSPEEINKLIPFFEFPLDRYYDAKNVNADRLFKIYSDSYFKSLSFHHVKDFENRMTISRQTDGSIKIIVGCTFEFSTSQSPADKRTRNVFNVYVLNANGQIKSVYQLI